MEPYLQVHSPTCALGLRPERALGVDVESLKEMPVYISNSLMLLVFPRVAFGVLYVVCLGSNASFFEATMHSGTTNLNPWVQSLMQLRVVSIESDMSLSNGTLSNTDP